MTESFFLHEKPSEAHFHAMQLMLYHDFTMLVHQVADVFFCFSDLEMFKVVSRNLDHSITSVLVAKFAKLDVIATRTTISYVSIVGRRLAVVRFHYYQYVRKYMCATWDIFYLASSGFYALPPPPPTINYVLLYSTLLLQNSPCAWWL